MSDGVEPVRAAAYADLKALFSPSVVAVVGASDDAGKFGGRVLAYLNSGAWGGTALPVHPRQDRVQGLRAAPSIAAAGVAIDLAVIAAPQASVESTLAQCAAAGVKAAVVFASGYAEAGEAGRAKQRQMLAHARQHGVRLLGPNCIGLVNERERFAATFATMWQDGWADAGAISVVSQSGAMASYLYVMLRERGLGVANWCSTGNEADVDVAECIAYLARDPGTRVVMAALEGVTSGPRLLAALTAARQAGKPVILLKMGRSDVGREAAASHTGALAGEQRVFDAAVLQAGALLASSFARPSTWPPPSSPRRSLPAGASAS